jgi:hypothetical protein
MLSGVAGVHVEAERAVVELRGADLDQLAEFGLEVLGGRSAERHPLAVGDNRDGIIVGFPAAVEALCGVLAASGL